MNRIDWVFENIMDLARSKSSDTPPFFMQQMMIGPRHPIRNSVEKIFHLFLLSGSLMTFLRNYGVLDDLPRIKP